MCAHGPVSGGPACVFAQDGVCTVCVGGAARAESSKHYSYRHDDHYSYTLSCKAMQAQKCPKPSTAKSEMRRRVASSMSLGMEVQTMGRPQGFCNNADHYCSKGSNTKMMGLQT